MLIFLVGFITGFLGFAIGLYITLSIIIHRIDKDEEE